MKYKIDKTDLQVDNKLHSEGSEVELTKEQTKGIEDYLIPTETNSHPEPCPELVSGSATVSGSPAVSGSKTNNGKKIKTKGNKK